MGNTQCVVSQVEGLSCLCALPLSALQSPIFRQQANLSFANFLTSVAYLRWTGFGPWSPFICFSAQDLCFCLCSTSMACRVCVLTFQGLGDDYSVMVVQRVLLKNK